ncbi:hypothetical protein R6Q57_020925 [Mikania cordata]
MFLDSYKLYAGTENGDQDKKCQVPNGLGSLSATVQLLLYATYYGSTNWDDDDDDEQGKVQMSSTSNA